MPLYEYKCEKCGNGFEILIRGDEHPRCPGCGSSRLAKKFSTFGFKSGSKVMTSARAGSCSTCTPSPGQCGTCR